MRVLRPLFLLCLGVLAFACSACGRADRTAAGTQGAPAATAGFEHRFTIAVDGHPVRLRLAVHEHERARGLMHVASMPEDEGMLFVFPAPQRMSFYMRNTRIPLDIGYYTADGVLREVYPMYPYVEDAVLSAGDRMQLALEMNQGWYARHGVRPGSSIDLAAVRAALRERGVGDGMLGGR